MVVLPRPAADMHMPFCTVADRCLRCDNVRANREIKRLREVLRTTMDELIAEREEVKDANRKFADLNAKFAKLEGAWYSLQAQVVLAKQGKISVSKLPTQGLFC